LIVYQIDNKNNILHTMRNYLSTNNIENIKYQISVFKNNPETNQKQKDILDQAETFICSSKLLSRLYCFFELSRLSYYLFNRKSVITKSTFMLIRIYSFWLITNIVTNIYLEKQMEQLKSSSSKGFTKYITNKMI
jgi:hypothetical protein